MKKVLLLTIFFLSLANSIIAADVRVNNYAVREPEDFWKVLQQIEENIDYIDTFNLSIEYCLDKECSTALFQALKNKKNIKILSIDACFTISALSDIIRSLELETLSLGYNVYSDQLNDIEVLWGEIANQKSLKTLHIMVFAFSQEKEHWEIVLRAVKNSSIEKIYIKKFASTIGWEENEAAYVEQIEKICEERLNNNNNKMILKTPSKKIWELKLMKLELRKTVKDAVKATMPRSNHKKSKKRKKV